MKTETAKQAAELLAKIKDMENKIEHLSKIRKNINISIKGKNEDLKEYALFLYTFSDELLVSDIYNHIEQHLMNEVNDLNNKLRQL